MRKIKKSLILACISFGELHGLDCAECPACAVSKQVKVLALLR